MASTSSIPKPHIHARSVSLPSISSQISEFDNFEATTSSSSMGQKDMVNEMVDELLRLLELCSTAKEALLMTRDSAQQLQSALRRKRGDNIGVSSAIQEYQSQRKAVNKIVLKTFRHLNGTSINKKNKETPLREVESSTLKMVESFLCFIIGSNLQKKSTKWSMISKMIGTKNKCDESSETSPVEKVDTELAKKSASFQVENVQKELSKLEMSLEDFQDALDSIYRNLIKSRVSLLNTLNC